MNAVAQANETFESLPADLRSRFENDPEKFVTFCLDKDNQEELIKLGLADKPAEVVEAAPVKVEVVVPAK
jgi:phage internal scaffolding protein